MSHTFRTLIHVIVLTATAMAGVGLGARLSDDSAGSGARPSTSQLAESRFRAAPVGRTVSDAEPLTLELPRLAVRLDPSRELCGQTEGRFPRSPSDGDQPEPVLALHRTGRELAELVDDLGRRRRLLDEMHTEITRIEDLGLRIADWAGTDNDPLLDRLVAQRSEAILALVGGDRDLARHTVRHVSGGMGVVEAVERGSEEVFAVRVEDLMTALSVSRATGRSS